jgi:POT family proton-dependent oligopeptide transporter
MQVPSANTGCPAFAGHDKKRRKVTDLTVQSKLASNPGTDLFGHPRGLTFLFTTEMWERFSYYGMRSLLVLYMTKYLLLPEHAGGVRGLDALKTALESVFGHLDVQPLSSQIWGLYTGLVYFTPILGGLLADRVLGQRRTVIVGASLMAIGHFMMAVEPLFLLALLFLILGNGCFKPNISTQVGGLYPPGDPRRDRAYSIFYVGINVGAFLAPLICGTLGEKLGYHYGFATAGVGMCLGLIIYLFASPLLPPDELQKRKMKIPPPQGVGSPPSARSRASSTRYGEQGGEVASAPSTAPSGSLTRANLPPAGGGGEQPLTTEQWRAIVALLVLYIPTTLFWATYEQMGNTTILWIDKNVDRTIDLFGFTAQIPTTWFLAFNPFMIFAFTPFVVMAWKRQAARRVEPSTITKMSLGCFGVVAANLVKAFAAYQAGAGQASWLWVLGSIAIITVGELYLSPIGLSLVTKVAPARILSMMMGVWLSTNFVGGFLAGYLGSFWSRMQPMQFFLMIAAVAAIAGIAIFLCRWPLKGALRE